MPNTLTKLDIIDAIQKENGCSRKQSSEITETLLEIIKRSIKSGENVMISGFGKFQVKFKKERKPQPSNRCGSNATTEKGGHIQVFWELEGPNK